MTKGFVLGRRKDGLGARLLMLLNCQWLAREMGCEVRFQWDDDNPIAPEISAPEDLFATGYCKKTFLGLGAYQKLSAQAVDIDEFLNDATPDRLRAHLDAGKHVRLERGFQELHFAWDDRAERATRLPAEFERLKLLPLVKTRAAKLKERLDAVPRPCTAYHIRRGDLFDTDPWKQKYWRVKYQPLPFYLAHMRETKPATILIFSDAPGTSDTVRRAEPSARAIAELIDTQGLTTMQRDFLELFAMTRADMLVAPSVSAFSLAAGRLSGRGHRATIEDLDPAMQIAAQTETLADLKAEMKEGQSALMEGEAASAFASAQEFWAAHSDEKRDKLIARIGTHLAGQENAPPFVSFYTALQAAYMQDWPRAARFAQAVLSHPKTWKQDHALAYALLGLALCKMGKKKQGIAAFLDGYWQKPLLPDIYIIGSHLFFRGFLKPNGPVFFDRSLLDSTRLKAVQSAMQIYGPRVNKRRPLDFSALAVEWPYFVIDKDMAGTVEHREMLQNLDQRMARIEKDMGRTTSAILSFRALVAAKLGNMEFAIRESRRCQPVAKSHALIPKRHAEIMLMAGRTGEATMAIEFAVRAKPERADFRFLASEIWRQAGDDARADAHLEIAAQSLHVNAMILHKWATRASELGREKDAQQSIAEIEARAPLHRRLTKIETESNP